jgi:excinuclease UvrABC nuclease subunit
VLDSPLSFFGIPESSSIYVLGRASNSTDYVGRADCDLSSRIRQSAGEWEQRVSKATGPYRWCWWRSADSPTEAFLLECRYYHLLKPSDNAIHPAAPFWSTVRCPIPLCDHREPMIWDLFPKPR